MNENENHHNTREVFFALRRYSFLFIPYPVLLFIHGRNVDLILKPMSFLVAFRVFIIYQKGGGGGKEGKSEVF